MLGKDELLARLTDIGTTADDAERRSLLTLISEDINAVYDANETLTAANTKFEADNKKLQEYNMQMFLKLGNQTKQPVQEKTEQKEVLKYEELFNDKGELK